jgi:hypothetical protein
MVEMGTFTKLNEKLWPGCYCAKSDPTDVARVEDRTFICPLSRDSAGPTNNWAHPLEMRRKLKQLFSGSMRGRNELCVLREELMKPAHNMKTAGNGVKNHVALFIRKKAACWGQTNNKNGRVSVPVRKCFIEITDDTNTIRHSIKNHSGIAFVTRAIDYRSDHIGFALTDKTVRRLPINFSEVSFAIHNSDRSNRNTADSV